MRTAQCGVRPLSVRDVAHRTRHSALSSPSYGNRVHASQRLASVSASAFRVCVCVCGWRHRLCIIGSAYAHTIYRIHIFMEIMADARETPSIPQPKQQKKLAIIHDRTDARRQAWLAAL